MEQKQIIEMIGTLSDAKGVSGFEDEVVLRLREYCAGLGDITEDKMRNLYLHRAENKGKRPLIQLDAHSDEVGFMVQGIQSNGMLSFITLGGWTPSTVPAHRVFVQTRTGEYIPGVVASKPPHFLSEAERKAAPVIENMAIDIGAASREEAEKDFGVRIGAPVVPDASFFYDEKHGLLHGKAFDCRLGCATLLAVMHKLKGKELPADIVAAFAVQEEVGLRGARVTSQTVKPDVAIVFEGTPADDTFGDIAKAQTVLKKGPMLRHADSSMLANPRFQRMALDLGEKLGLPVQQAVRTGGGTNAGAIHLANNGVPVIVIGLPVRYIHTHYGIAAYQDVQAAVELACAVIEKLDAQCIEGF